MGGGEMDNEVIESLKKSLRKRQRGVAICFFISLLLLLFMVAYGLKGVGAASFLVEKNAITPYELLKIIQYWFWAIVASIVNYLVFFAAWFHLDKELIGRLINPGGEEPQKGTR